LYGAAENRLAKDLEYAGRYNLGEEVPIEHYVSYTERYKHASISTKGRGNLCPVYEKAYNHYHNRMKMGMP